MLQRFAGVLYTVPGCQPRQRAERSNSVFKFVWSDKRARTLTGRVAMLVYIYLNYRVLMRSKERVRQQDWDAFLEWLDSLPLRVLCMGDGVLAAELVAGER